MVEKASKGVKIFGWIFIITALVGLLAPFCSKGSACSLKAKPLLDIFWSSIGLVAGAFILKRKEWARKLEIVLRLFLICFAIYNCFKMMPQINKAMSDKGMQKEAKSIFDAKIQEKLKMYKPEYQEQMRAQYEKAYGSVLKKAPPFLYSIWFLLLIWYVSIIFFFTRKEVRAQFNPRLQSANQDGSQI